MRADCPGQVTQLGRTQTSPVGPLPHAQTSSPLPGAGCVQVLGAQSCGKTIAGSAHSISGGAPRKTLSARFLLGTSLDISSVSPLLSDGDAKTCRDHHENGEK